MDKVKKFITTYKQSLLLGLILVAVLVWWLKQGQSPESLPAEESSTSREISLATEVFGENAETGASIDNLSSWPGEILSASDIQVQPQREGTIVEWKVKIGQRVTAGQTLARLSAPPASPDLIQSLAEQAENLAKARSTSQATIEFAEKNRASLLSLKSSLEASNKSGQNILGANGSTSQASLNQAKASAELKRKKIREIAEQLLSRHLNTFTYSQNPYAYVNFYNSTSGFKQAYGWLDENSRSGYEQAFLKLVNELKDPQAIPISTGEVYVKAASRLVASSYAVQPVTSEELEKVRKEIADDQNDFLDAVNDYKQAEAEISSKEIEYQLALLGQNKEYSEKIKDIDEKIADLDRQIAIAKGEAQAAGAAYATVSGAINGGLNITAPRAGIVSIIGKQTGEFVKPDSVVASINSGNSKDYIIRFRVPGNGVPPKTGDELSVVRPGFPKDAKKVKIAGIGVSLDGNGSYFVDADLLDQVDWPVHASVRVLAQTGGEANNLTSLSAVWWDADNHANVWIVDNNNSLRPQEVKTGRTLGDKIEILEGISKGDRIVSNATSELKSGTKVNQTVETPNESGSQIQDESQPHSHDE